MQREKLPGGVFKGGPGAGLYLLCEREAVRAFGRDRLDSGERYPEGHAGAGGHFLPDGAAAAHLTGVTGTKGKTTTSYYIKAILDVWEKKQQGKETGILSSVDIYDGKELVPAKMTTPEAIEIHRHIRNCADESIRYLTMEVSSQALKYKRVRGLKFDVGIFLNISEDHISPCEHENFEDYFTSKLSLFKQTKVACVNLDSARRENPFCLSDCGEGADLRNHGSAGYLGARYRDARGKDFLLGAL